MSHPLFSSGYTQRWQRAHSLSSLCATRYHTFSPVSSCPSVETLLSRQATRPHSSFQNLSFFRCGLRELLPASPAPLVFLPSSFLSLGCSPPHYHRLSPPCFDQRGNTGFDSPFPCCCHLPSVVFFSPQSKKHFPFFCPFNFPEEPPFPPPLHCVLRTPPQHELFVFQHLFFSLLKSKRPV